MQSPNYREYVWRSDSVILCKLANGCNIGVFRVQNLQLPLTPYRSRSSSEGLQSGHQVATKSRNMSWTAPTYTASLGRDVYLVAEDTASAGSVMQQQHLPWPSERSERV